MKTAPFKPIQSNTLVPNNISIYTGIIPPKQRCTFRFKIFGNQNDSIDIAGQFRHYIQNVVQLTLGIKNEICGEDVSKQSMNTEEQESNQVSSNHQQQSNESQEKEDILNFLGKQKLNVYKNILYAFNKHIDVCEDEELIDLYQSFTDKWDFGHIKKRVNQNLKDSGRPSLKFRNLLKSKNLKNIFIHFLKNAQKFWLNGSKIQKKDIYIKSIELLLKGTDYGIVVKNIQYYRKNKK